MHYLFKLLLINISWQPLPLALRIVVFIKEGLVCWNITIYYNGSKLQIFV